MSKSKRVLYVTRPIDPPWDEASKNFTKDLVFNISSVEPYILTSKEHDFPKHISQLPIYSSSELNTAQKLKLLKLPSLIKKHEIDIVHLLFTPTKQNSKLLKKLIPSDLQTIQTVASLPQNINTKTDMDKYLFADKIITYSKYSLERLKELGYNNITHIYPGVDLARYSPGKKTPEALKGLESKEDDFIILYPGEYSRLGAVPILKQSMASIFEAIPTAKFIFANRIKSSEDERQRDSLIQEAQKHGYSSSVVHSGTIADMPAAFRAADVVVFPIENMLGKFDVPLAVVEAMASAKPVIVSSIEVLAEFTNEGQTIQISGKNPEEFVSQLVKLASDKDTREELGRKAREFTEANFDIKNIAQQYEQLYEGLDG